MTLGNESDVNCSSPNPIPPEIWATRVAVFAIGGTTVAAFGLLCNIVSIIVLAHFRQKSSAPFLLICLEAVDTLLLLSEMILETLATLSQAGLLTDAYRDVIRPVYVVMYPLPHIAQTGTTMMTVLITLERYVAVARPLLACRVCSKTWARRAVLVVCVWSILFQTPLYMAYTFSHQWNPATNSTKIVFYRTEFGKGAFYNDWYVVWINLFCEFLIPFTVIVVLNVLMIRALRASNTFSPETAAVTTSNKRSQREGRLTGIVIAITAIFFVCELFPALALIIVRGKDAFTECSVACAHFVSVADTMVLVNSAVNFVAYCVIGKQFREIFVALFFRRCRRRGAARGDKRSPGGAVRDMDDSGTSFNLNGHGHVTSTTALSSYVQRRMSVPTEGRRTSAV
nr:hypothetical protein BaRGS_022413 [Batillaria attramentaria]